MEQSFHRAVQDYLRRTITEYQTYELTPTDEKVLNRSKQEYIFGKIMSKKYRKRSISQQIKEDIYRKVGLSIEKSMPIHFTIPFGGYKHFQNPSHPEPDWAEVFQLAFMRDFASSIAIVHAPGVLLDYISEDLIVPYMNNYDPDVFERYCRLYRLLVELFNKNAPQNVRFQFWRVKDRVDKEKLIGEVMNMLPERLEQFRSLTKEQQELEIIRSKRNINWIGSKDLDNLSDNEKRDWIIRSHLLEFAYYDTEAKEEYIGDYLQRDNHIYTLFSFGFTHDNTDGWLSLGSCSSSIVDFWVGRGVLEKRGEEFIPRILSKKQYDKYVGFYKNVPVDIGLNGRNYSSVDVFEGIMEFN
jgi:hypothetical protein